MSARRDETQVTTRDSIDWVGLFRESALIIDDNSGFDYDTDCGVRRMVEYANNGAVVEK